MTTHPDKRPQLSFDELQQLKWLLGGVLTLLGVSTVLYMDVDAWALMALTALATVSTVLWPTLPARVPPLVHTLTFPAIVAFFAADLWLKTEVLPAMVRLDILLLLYRNITYRQRRDDLQIVVLGLFLVVVAGVLTVSLTFAAQILVYTGAALALLLVVTLSDAVPGGAARPAVAPGETPAWARHADWPHLFRRLREVTDWRVVGLGAVLFAGVVAVSALLFLAIPRFQLENSMFLDRLISKKAKSGFSDTIRFGDVTEIQQDNSLALTVDVSDQSQIPSSPYWRMLVLDQYDNGTFRMSPQLRGQEFRPERAALQVLGDAKSRQGTAVYWTFYLESGISRYLPVLGQFEVLRFREMQNFRHAPGLAAMALRDEPVSMTAYRVEGIEFAASLPDPAFGQLWAKRVTPQTRRVALQDRLYLREPDLAALRRAVAEITGGQPATAADFARKTSEWLRRKHSYSLSPAIPGGDGDPLVRWLLSSEAGHCELFAGSLVLLARAAGYPARVVTGFRGGSWNGYSNNFTIRNADAHAWAELFDEASGAWLRADPLGPTATAQADDVRGAAALVSRLDRSWKARLDSLRVFWYRRIVSFDQQSQVETLKAMKSAAQNSGKRFRAALDSVGASLRAWFAEPWDFRRWLKVVFTIVLAVGTVMWWRTQGRTTWRAWAQRRGGSATDPVRRESSRWLSRLAPWAGRGAEVEMAAVVAQLKQLRFGRRATGPEAERVFRQARQILRGVRRRPRQPRR